MAARLQSMRVVHAIQVTYGMRQGAASHSRTWALFRSVSSTLSTPRAVPPLHFDRFPLDRAGEKRRDQACVNTMIQSPDSIVVMFIDGKPVVGLRGSEAVKSFSTLSGDNLLDAQGNPVKKMPWVVSMGQFRELSGEQNPELVFLGMHGTSPPIPVFTANVSLDLEDSRVQERGLEVVDARRYGPKLCAEDASVLATASGLLSWHKNAQFDPRSGKEASEIVLGGHGRHVPGETRVQYPRIDPAVIVSVEHGDWLLLGRKSSWIPGRYSLLAGFVELAESLEDAACREVREESGVAVSRKSLVYHSSQPWPFPRSLMVGLSGSTQAIEQAPYGFDLLNNREAQLAARGTGLLEEELNDLRASLTLPEIIVDEDEMEDIRWFHSSYLRKQLAGASEEGEKEPEMRIPGKHAVASSIIHDTLDRLECNRDDKHALDVVSSVDLGPQDLPGVGVRREMKYVLLRVATRSNGEYTSKLIVRGDPRASYHNHIYTQAKAELRQFDLDVLGGGRIVVDDEIRQISVYGYSAAFGAAVHEVSRTILLQTYPLYGIGVSYEGY